MSFFTYADAINAGLKTELMTEVIPPDTDTVVTPAVLSGTYRLGTTKNSNEKFTGYAFRVTQNLSNATSISGEFISTEDFLEFAKDLKDSGATLQLEDDYSGTMLKFTAAIAIAQGLIFRIRSGETEVKGSFEISEGVIKIFQQPFSLKQGSNFGFTTADELITFLERCLKDLKMFDQVKRMWNRNSYRYLLKIFQRRRLCH